MMYTLILTFVLHFSAGSLPVIWAVPNLTKAECLNYAEDSLFSSGVDLPEGSYKANSSCVDSEGRRITLTPRKKI